MNDYYVLQKPDGTLAQSGRPYTIRVYESLESAKRGKKQIWQGKNCTIMKFTSGDLVEVK